ncbi:hypothetical protein [Rhizobium tumorigenes]|uniref:hypothetical protein n=1 Tax=Rhizobium tumorigenes TaxID=2041385 RepID=UPI00241CD3FA|nr:hypothetical protein [Rhizobium tumorigenes]WFS02191.1 hypothetical protein PR016_06145 [Rhizobium tumorigenes]
MSDVVLIATAYAAPTSPTPEQNTSFHKQFLSDINAEAARRGWDGSSVHVYLRMPVGDVPYVSITIAPGERWADLDDLRAFREQQRAQRDLEMQQPEQGRMF